MPSLHYVFNKGASPITCFVIPFVSLENARLALGNYNMHINVNIIAAQACDIFSQLIHTIFIYLLITLKLPSENTIFKRKLAP